MTDKLLGLLGLARRGGNLCFGFDAVCKAVAQGKAQAVLLAQDASERTAAEIGRRCEGSQAELLRPACTMAALGGAIGRNDTAVVAVLDRSLANRVKELCNCSRSAKLEEE